MMNFPPLLDAGGLYLTGEDNLRLTTFGGVAGVTVVLEGRLVGEDGKIVPISERQVPNSDYTAKQSIFVLAAGVLTNAHLRASVGSVGRGGVFAILEVVRGTTVNGQALATILQGYVTTNARLAYPGSPIESSTAGAGRLRSITGADPAAGAEIIETVPAGVRWRVIAFRAVLVTSAVVANRRVVFNLDDGAAQYYNAGASADQAASQSVAYMFSSGFGLAVATAGPQIVPAPGWLVLPPGHRIRTATTLLDGGDNWAAPQYTVEEFIE